MSVNINLAGMLKISLIKLISKAVMLMSKESNGFVVLKI